MSKSSFDVFQYMSNLNTNNISFGRYPYPAEETVNQLESNGYEIFIDLTNEKDKIIPYKNFLSKKSKYIHYPISDKRIPKSITDFFIFLNDLVVIIKSKKIYIHCRGGHGRAGLFVACLLKHLNPEILQNQALKIVYDNHQKRPDMNPRWRKMGSPQTKKQKEFVFNYFLFFDEKCKNVKIKQ